MEEFGRLESSDKTIAILGDRWWPQTGKQDGDRTSKQFLCNIWKKRNERRNVGGVPVRSRNGAPSRKGDAWSMVRLLQGKQRINPPSPPPPLLFCFCCLQFFLSLFFCVLIIRIKFACVVHIKPVYVVHVVLVFVLTLTLVKYVESWWSHKGAGALGRSQKNHNEITNHSAGKHSRRRRPTSEMNIKCAN